MKRAVTKKLPSLARLSEVVQYDQDTGVFRWMVDGHGPLRKGNVAGSVDRGGYRSIKIDQVPYLAHRLAWLIVTGEEPVAEIDHINGERDDNRALNLRDVSRGENCQNMSAVRPANTSTGLLGAHANWWGSGFTAAIMLHGKKRHLGTFKTPEEAHAMYIKAKKQIHTHNERATQ